MAHAAARDGTARLLEDLAAEAVIGGPPGGLERIMVKGLLREYHGRSADERRRMIEREPTLTGTVWDAVIGAAVEHACTTHGDPVPAWTQRTERFNPEPVCHANTALSHGTKLSNAPAAFIRHNTFIDVWSLDHRTGERHVWATNERTPTEAVRKDGPADRPR